MFEKEENALALAPLGVMPMILFGGLFSNNDKQFDWLSWIQYISPIKYAAESIVYNEFMYDKYGVLDSISSFLDYSLGQAKCMLIMLAMVLGFRTLAFFFFKRLASKA